MKIELNYFYIPMNHIMCLEIKDTSIKDASFMIQRLYT